MTPAPIVIISGPPGAGKSMVARKLAERSNFLRAIHLHTDDFYGYIRKGFIFPWLPESQDQNIVVIEAIVASTKRYAAGGFEVFVDGVIGPWFLTPWLSAVQEGFDVHFVVLRPDEPTTVARAVERQEPGALVNPQVVGTMWRYFADLGQYEPHALDTSRQTLDQTVAAVQQSLAGGRLRLTCL